MSSSSSNASDTPNVAAHNVSLVTLVDKGVPEDNTAKCGHELWKMRLVNNRPFWLQSFKTYENENLIKREILYLKK